MLSCIATPNPATPDPGTRTDRRDPPGTDPAARYVLASSICTIVVVPAFVLV